MSEIEWKPGKGGSLTAKVNGCAILIERDLRGSWRFEVVSAVSSTVMSAGYETRVEAQVAALGTQAVGERPFRSEGVSVKGSGGYVDVWQHPGGAPQLETAFFDSTPRSIGEMVARQRALTKAIRIAKSWRAEDAQPRRRSS